jgi:23S rRNA pseudouridine1911/1915/1917 synthase
MDDSSKYFYTPQWPVFYEDNHLFALYKPAGLLIQGDRTQDITLMDLAKQWIKVRHQKPGKVFLGLVHRLDRTVAGVVLFCRTSKAAGRISEQFRSGKTQKEYVAIVEGILPEKSGELVNHIERRGSSGKVVECATAKSSEARLSYRVVDTYKSLSLVEIDLHTGKHHQIRLQLANLGFPILGDLRYGGSAPMPDRQIALFAHILVITHPTLDQRLAFTSPFPNGWPWPKQILPEDRPPWNWQEMKTQVMLQYLNAKSL